MKRQVAAAEQSLTSAQLESLLTYRLDSFVEPPAHPSIDHEIKPSGVSYIHYFIENRST